MIHWMAGLAAAAMAWVINRYLVVRGGDKAVIWLVPPLEEILKTGFALLTGAPIPLSHGAFGVLEAVHDYAASPRWGFWAGLSSITSHFFLGLCTQLIYRLYFSWALAVFLAALAHILWNLVIIGYLAPLLTRPRK